jgi:hypothetical protein
MANRQAARTIFPPDHLPLERLAAVEAARRSKAVALVLMAVVDGRVILDSNLSQSLARLAASSARWAARCRELGEVA